MDLFDLLPHCGLYTSMSEQAHHQGDVVGVSVAAHTELMAVEIMHLIPYI